jgi:hypothetical protein
MSVMKKRLLKGIGEPRHGIRRSPGLDQACRFSGAAAESVSSTNGSDQLGVQRYLGLQNCGDRAVLLGVLGHLEEFGFIEVRRFRAQRERGATDAETFAFRFKRDGRPRWRAQSA